jgi:hypothetical protein
MKACQPSSAHDYGISAILDRNGNGGVPSIGQAFLLACGSRLAADGLLKTITSVCGSLSLLISAGDTAMSIVFGGRGSAIKAGGKPSCWSIWMADSGGLAGTSLTDSWLGLTGSWLGFAEGKPPDPPHAGSLKTAAVAPEAVSATRRGSAWIAMFAPPRAQGAVSVICGSRGTMALEERVLYIHLVVKGQ